MDKKKQIQFEGVDEDDDELMLENAKQVDLGKHSTVQPKTRTEQQRAKKAYQDLDDGDDEIDLFSIQKQT